MGRNMTSKLVQAPPLFYSCVWGIWQVHGEVNKVRLGQTGPRRSLSQSLTLLGRFITQPRIFHLKELPSALLQLKSWFSMRCCCDTDTGKEGKRFLQKNINVYIRHLQTTSFSHELKGIWLHSSRRWAVLPLLMALNEENTFGIILM